MNPITYFLLTLFGGMFGIHKFSTGKKGMGILYLCTGGLFCIGWIYDIIIAIQNIIKYKKLTQETNFEYSKIIFNNTFLIVGTTYECRKNPKKHRSAIIKQTQCSTPVHIEEYYYNNKRAYMIVNSMNNLDLGVLSEGAASWLASYISRGLVFAKLVDRYSDSFRVNIIVVED